MSNSITVRYAEDGDTAFLERCRCLLDEETRGGLPRWLRAESAVPPLGEAAWRRAVQGEGGFALTACCGAQRVGMAHIVQRGADACLLQSLYVLPAFRAQGAGKALLQCAQQQAAANGCAYMSLNTLYHNAAARALYRSAGFAEQSVWMAKTL